MTESKISRTTNTTSRKQRSEGRSAPETRKLSATLDKHLLYQEAVQSVEPDLDFCDRVFRRLRGRRPAVLREDFCGTALLACEWVRRRPVHRAIGVDIDRATLDWGRRHNVAALGDRGQRITLRCRDVLDVRRPRVDLLVAFNYSYFLFKDRARLRRYFKAACSSLQPDGLFIADAYAGTSAMAEEVEEHRIKASTTSDGRKLPAFTYVWDQARFNGITHETTCHIHFKFRDGSKMQRAFTYDWRLWTIPEIREVMQEAGFAASEVYIDGWDDDEDEADGVFRRRTSYENMAAWNAYIVGLK